jgi:hypothetical protein
VIPSLAAHVLTRHRAKFLVEQRYQLRECAGIAAAPVRQ